VIGKLVIGHWSLIIGHFPFPHSQRLEDHQGHEQRVVDQIPPPEAPGFGEQAEEPFQAGALLYRLGG